MELLEKLTGKRSQLTFSGWRQSDQKVYVSNIGKIMKELSWIPKVSPEEGLNNLVRWVSDNRDLF